MSYTPLHKAASRSDVDEARELLKHGRCDVNCRDIVGWTPLHKACVGGHVDMVRILISEFQADTTLLDRWGDTPLHNGSFHVKSTRKIDDPYGFFSNLVRPMHIQSNLVTPNFSPICQVFSELWLFKSLSFGAILIISAVLRHP